MSFKGTLSTVAVRFGAKTVNLIVFICVARFLSLRDMGVYGAIFASSIILSTILDLGVRNSIAVFIGQDPEMTSEYMRSALFIWAIGSIIAVPAMMIVLFAYDYQPFFYSIGIPSCTLTIAMLFIRIFQGPLIGRGDIAKLNNSDLINRVVLLICTVVAFATVGFTLYSSLWMLAFSQTVSAVYLFAIQRDWFRGSWSTFPAPNLYRLMRRGIIFMFTVLLMNVAQRMSFYLIGYRAGVTESGLFFGLQRLTEVLTEVGVAVSVIMFSNNIRSTSPVEAARQTARATRTTFAILFVLACCFSLVSPWLVPQILGPKFEGHIELTLLLVVGTLLGVPWTMLFPSLSVASTPRAVFVLFLPGITIGLIMTLISLSFMGVKGGAVGLLFGNLCLSLTFAAKYQSMHGIPIKSFFIPSISEFKPGRRSS